MSTIAKQLKTLTIRNFEVLDRYDQLTAEGKKPLLGLRKTWQGKEVFLINEKEPLSFMNMIRHPLDIAHRISNVWARFKTTILQKISIDNLKNEDIAIFRDSLKPKIHALANTPAILHLANQISGREELEAENQLLRGQLEDLQVVSRLHAEGNIIKDGLEEKLRQAEAALKGLNRSAEKHGFKTILDFVSHHNPTTPAEVEKKKTATPEAAEKKILGLHLSNPFTHHPVQTEAAAAKLEGKPVRKKKDKSDKPLKEEHKSHHHSLSKHKKASEAQSAPVLAQVI